ncbi:hypothetical protein TELCIR_03754 [Teladorsagia circumcincta]|uniref:Uncharacterized protein n=1 Tax=Teladorsagia circumcincta TaxID=45464 RepID=A0A2G9UVG2_TELCI|nr:hypothetical protein TELCIR_03754 [Teladorsagia circumcincta]
MQWLARDLSKNNLRDIDPNAFRGLKKLRTLLNAKHVKEAIARYTGASSGFGKGKAITDRARNQVFTKAEHDEKVALGIAYLDAVLVGNRDEAVTQIRAACDNLWQGGMRGCEQISMTGNRCQLKRCGFERCTCEVAM